MAVSDYQAGRVVATLPIGTGVDGAGFDPASGDVFASNADGRLTVIHQDTPDTYHVIENVETPMRSRNIGLDPTNHRVFVVSANLARRQLAGEVDLRCFPEHSVCWSLSAARQLASASQLPSEVSARHNTLWHEPRGFGAA